MRTMRHILILTAIAVFAVGPAYAHSKLISSEPAAGGVITAPPDRVELVFSVKVQPSMSSIVVIGPDGTKVAAGPLESSPDGKTVWIPLGSQPPAGDYKVEWRALSADDHVIKGDFAFKFEPPAKEVTSSFSAPPAPPVDHSQMDHSKMDHSMHAGEEGVNWPQSLVRWLAYLAMMLLSGGLAFRLFAAAAAADDAASLEAFDRASGRVFVFAAVLSLVAAIAGVLLQTAAVFDSISPDNVTAVVANTSFGPPWILQTSAAALGLVFVLIAGAVAGVKRTPLLWAALAASLAVLVSPGLTGHARAASADYRFAIVSDWLHLASAAVWVGGLVMLATAVPAAVTASTDRMRTLSGFVAGFNKLAIASVMVVTATGLYNSWIHVEGFGALVGSTYGWVLVAKVAISLMMIAIGGYNAYIVHPRIISAAVGANETLNRNVRIEVALAAVVLLLAALLAFLPPAREHSPLGSISAVSETKSPR